MFRFLSVSAAGLGLFLTSGAEAFAQQAARRVLDGPTPQPVPEIDASTGLLAMAAVAAMLLLAYEIRRRRAAGRS